MKLAGRERDIEIAGLKGIKKISQSSERYETGLDQSDYFLYYIPSGKPWRTHTIDAKLLPHWSTDRDSAWELLKELHEAERLDVGTIEIEFNEHWLNLESKWKGWKFASSVSKHGLDGAFADCVSQAWIKFMEATR